VVEANTPIKYLFKKILHPNETQANHGIAATKLAFTNLKLNLAHESA
jgi:hypothetical protein